MLPMRIGLVLLLVVAARQVLARAGNRHALAAVHAQPGEIQQLRRFGLDAGAVHPQRLLQCSVVRSLLLPSACWVRKQSAPYGVRRIINTNVLPYQRMLSAGEHLTCFALLLL